jgi:transposase-like protein
MQIYCPYCSNKNEVGRNKKNYWRIGHYYRHCDKSLVQRYKCGSCRRTFSDAYYSLHYRHRRRDVIRPLFGLLTGGFSLRRSAKYISINRKTVVRKFRLIGQFSINALEDLNRVIGKANEFQFDDLETFEHTKYKPLSVTLAVEKHTRRILGFAVSQMPAKGLLAKRAIKKYGFRQDLRKQGRRELFKSLNNLVSEKPKIESDMNPHYESDVRHFFNNSEYTQHRGRRGCVVGQGELKSGGFDPLFSLNHTCAMLRANINRLFRKTWCTTKKPECLKYHIAMYSIFHNLALLE